MLEGVDGVGNVLTSNDSVSSKHGYFIDTTEANTKRCKKSCFTGNMCRCIYKWQVNCSSTSATIYIF